jgi:pimeloyl-ACP methyl ester carboxylesterase
VYDDSMPIADPNFHKHRAIEADLADAWKDVQLGRPLGTDAQRVAAALRYELPQEQRAPAAGNSAAARTSRNDEARETRHTIRGLELCVTTWGPEDGPTVVIVHGILDHGGAWEAVARSLAERGYRVIAPDLRGHGRSAHVVKGDCYYGLDFVADVDALVRTLVPEPAVLVGHSMGGAISVMFASARRELVRWLIMIEPLVPSAATDRDPALQLTTHLDYIASEPAHTVFDGIEQAATILRHQTPSLSSETASRLARRLTEPCKGGLRWTWDPLLRTRTGIGFDSPFERASYFEMVRSLTCPVTLVVGEQSAFHRSQNHTALIAAVPSVRQVVLAGGHNLHFDAPKELAEIISSATSESAARTAAPNRTSTLRADMDSAHLASGAVAGRES